MARLYHLFFISQKETINYQGTDYDAWVISVDGTDNYFMEKSDPHPEGVTVHDIVAVLASAGANDVIYFVTTNTAVALTATKADEFAGGSNTSTASAWLSFATLSFLQEGVHAGFAPGAAAKMVLPCRWLDGSENWQSGTLGDWITAGSPISGFHLDIALKILGAE